MTLDNSGNVKSKVAYIISVLEQTTVKTENNIYSSVAGNASDPAICVAPFTHRLEYSKELSNTKTIYENLGIEEGDVEAKKIGYLDTTPYVRGIFSPYLGIETESKNGVYNEDPFTNYTLINIKLNKNSSITDQVEIRK